jgi:hypothetical protein
MRPLEAEFQNNLLSNTQQTCIPCSVRRDTFNKRDSE